MYSIYSDVQYLYRVYVHKVMYSLQVWIEPEWRPEQQACKRRCCSLLAAAGQWC